MTTGEASAVRRLVAVVLVTAVVGSSVVGLITLESLPARAGNASTVEGTPHLNASAPDARLTPGQSGTVGVSITNDATYDDNNGTHPQEAIDRAGEARSVTVNISDTRTAPLTVETGSQSVGTIQDGETSGPHTFNVVIDEDAEAGTYTVDVTTHYRHAKQVTYEEMADGEYAYNETVVNRTETSTITVVIEPEARFEVTDLSHDIPLGGEGTVSVSVKNTGDMNVTESTLSLTSGDSNFYFGSGTATSEVSVGPWQAGETRTVRFRAGTTDSAVQREYPIDLSVSYRDDDDTQQSDSDQFGITPQARTEFEVVGVSHDVPRNGEGTLTVTVEQTAGKTISDVRVTARTDESEVYLGAESSRSASTFVDEWAREDQQSFTFRVGTTESAVNRAYSLEFQFDYTDADDNENARTEYVEFTPDASDRFEVTTVTHDVPQNGVGTVTIRVENTGAERLLDLAATASTTSSEVYVGSESSRSGTATLESIEPGATRKLTYRVGTTANAVNRSYPLELNLEYTDDANNDNQQTEQVEFRPQPEPQFKVVAVDHNAPVGGAGQLSLTLRNVGPVNATDASLTIASDVDALYFGTGGSSEPVQAGGFSFEPPQTGTPTSAAYVGDWPAGTNRTVYFRLGVDENAIEHPYTTGLTVDYENANGESMPSQSTSVGIEPRPEPRFTLQNVDSDLSVGEEGNLIGVVANTGNHTVEGVVLSMESQYQNINFYNPRYAIGRLQPGESARFRFRVSVTEAAEHGPRLFEISTRYRDPDGEIRTTDSQDLMISVGPDEQVFDLKRDQSQLSPGQSGTLAITVTNQHNETVRNVQAKLFTDDPLDSADDAAFISELGPGESSQITMDLSVAGSAMTKNYSVSLDFRYDNSRGESRLSDTYRVGVSVSEPAPGPNLGMLLGLGLVPFAVVVSAIGWRVGRHDRSEQGASGGLLARLRSWLLALRPIGRLRAWLGDRRE